MTARGAGRHNDRKHLEPVGSSANPTYAHRGNHATVDRLRRTATLAATLIATLAACTSGTATNQTATTPPVAGPAPATSQPAPTLQDKPARAPRPTAGPDRGNEPPATRDPAPTPKPGPPSFPQPRYPDPLPVKTGPASPLSGRPGGLGTRLIAVKIDNTPSAQPHAGLHHAALVYVQEVEGGLTRLLAIYGTDKPADVGPVRSARISDISLLAPFGNLTFTYSGAQTRLLPKLAKAPFVNATPADHPAGWYDQTWRPVSWNDHIARPRLLLNATGSDAVARDLGWTFTPDTPPGGKRTRSIEHRWSGSTVTFRWEPAGGGWVAYFDRKRSTTVEGGPIVATTVIIQYVKQTDSGYGDRYGGRTPLLHTVGKGDGILLRDGRRWPITWNRPDEHTPTTYQLTDGTTAPFAPGQTWILLADKNTRSSTATTD